MQPETAFRVIWPVELTIERNLLKKIKLELKRRCISVNYLIHRRGRKSDQAVFYFDFIGRRHAFIV